MNSHLKQYLIENFGLAADADDAVAKSLAKDKIASGDLSLDKYTELLNQKSETPKDKTAELAETIATKTSEAVVGGLGPKFDALISALGSKQKNADPEDDDDDDDGAPAPGEKSLDELEQKLMERFKDRFPKDNDGGDAQKLWKMSTLEDADPRTVRVKQRIEQWTHSPTAHVHKGKSAKLLGIDGRPIMVNDQEVNQLTERTKNMAAIWAKFQLFPEHMKEHEMEVVQWILHKEKFHVSHRGSGQAVYLTEDERHRVLEFNKNFYSHGHNKALIDDSTSGGEDSIPQFWDMDFIMSPTLASEDIPSYCNLISVPRGVAAQNFILGRPTIAAANTEGSATTVFSTTGFIVNHDTDFYRAAGFMEIGRNFLEDAHPGILNGVYQQYMNTVKLWLNEQIMTGDGTTEPQGVLVDTGTGDITPANPTTGAITLADALNMLFGVSKAYRENGGRNNAIYVMTDQTYKRFRSIATGVTGDTRLVFGESVEDYQLFGHPVLIEEGGMTNSDAAFFQAKGYRLYQRQGARMIREDRGDALVRKNAILVGVDVRYGGQLDEPGYAAVVDAFPA